MRRKSIGLSFLNLLLTAPVMAQPLVDGTIAGDDYGPAVSVQAVQTGFGDNFSELNAAYCTTDAGRLYLALTGNMEANFNGIEIFIDSRAGGENVLSGLPGNQATSNMAGLAFDAGFDADYHIFVRRGNLGGPRFDLYIAELGTANDSYYEDILGGAMEGSGVTGTGINAQPIGVGYDDSNVAGVQGGSGPANQAAALAVQTGLELSIALDDLGYIDGDIMICAFINNGDHNFASNQFLGPLEPPQDNLGGDGAGNFTGSLDFSLASFAGDQFFVCVPAVIPVESTTWGQIKTMW
jgi:hypothetical protein